jgi:hypothetical protein
VPSSHRRAVAGSSGHVSSFPATASTGVFGRSALASTTTTAPSVTSPRVVAIAAGQAIARGSDAESSSLSGSLGSGSRSDSSPGPGGGVGTGGGSGAFFFGAMALLALAGLAVPRLIGAVPDFRFCAALEPCLMLPERPG